MFCGLGWILKCVMWVHLFVSTSKEREFEFADSDPAKFSRNPSFFTWTCVLSFLLLFSCRVRFARWTGRWLVAWVWCDVHGVWFVGMHKVMWDQGSKDGFEVLKIVWAQKCGWINCTHHNQYLYKYWNPLAFLSQTKIGSIYRHTSIPKLSLKRFLVWEEMSSRCRRQCWSKHAAYQIKSIETIGSGKLGYAMSWCGVVWVTFYGYCSEQR
jgi:hypothetical protein